MENAYFDLEANQRATAAGEHRQLIGGFWDEIGKLQFKHLVSEGLRPGHTLLDIGCGPLRGGLHFVKYLDPGHYFGIDVNQPFLDAGYDVELARAGLQDRLPRENLICAAEFDPPLPDAMFDFAIAQSVFTHLMLNRIRQCLTRTARLMKPGGRLYATFFELPEGAPTDRPLRHEPGGIMTYDIRDPYHYRVSDFEFAIRGLPWRLRHIGDWHHPRGQRMLVFERHETATGPTSGQGLRSLSFSAAASLQAGDNHYRAYVGPPDRFDFMSATQFSLLFQCGMRDHHHVLDFGAGSLRLGRLLIPYLQPRRYHAIEPNTWLIDDAVAHELGTSAVLLKRPAFSSSDQFDCAAFGRNFDFIIAQSIVTHCGPDLFQKLMDSAAAALEPDGLFLFSYLDTPERDAHSDDEGWVYPGCVRYTQSEVHDFVRHAGLVGMAIPWFHPGASWFLAARHPGRLPSEAEAGLLRGAVLFDPQFAKSRETAPG